MPPVTKSLGEGTQSVLLTIAILENLAKNRSPVGISELARQIGTSKSRIYRHLQTLTSCDYVSNQTVTGEYHVGGQLVALCRKINERFDLVNIAQPTIAELVTRLGHTVIISRVDAAGVHVLQSSPGNSQIVVGVRHGTVLPFGNSAQGKVALAFMPASRRDDLSPFATAYQSFIAEHTDAELQLIRTQGWASAQMRAGLHGVAAPVFDAKGGLLATLALLDTAEDMGGNSFEYTTRTLVEAAKAISRDLRFAGVNSA